MQGCGRRLATKGITVREWRVDPVTGTLNLADLDELINVRTRLVAFPHASNVVAAVNPVSEVVARASAVGAQVVVDGVSYAPHGLPDVGSAGGRCLPVLCLQDLGSPPRGDGRPPGTGRPLGERGPLFQRRPSPPPTGARRAGPSSDRGLRRDHRLPRRHTHPPRRIGRRPGGARPYGPRPFPGPTRRTSWVLCSATWTSGTTCGCSAPPIRPGARPLCR